MSIKPWHLKKNKIFLSIFSSLFVLQLNHCQKIQALQLSIFNFCMSTELFFSTTQNQRQEAQYTSNKLFHFNSKFNYLRRGGQQKLRFPARKFALVYLFFNVGSGLYFYTISGLLILPQGQFLISISCWDAPLKLSLQYK